MGRRELQTFFEQHYGPPALTIAIVGDVTIEQVSMPVRQSPPGLHSVICRCSLTQRLSLVKAAAGLGALRNVKWFWKKECLDDSNLNDCSMQLRNTRSVTGTITSLRHLHLQCMFCSGCPVQLSPGLEASLSACCCYIEGSVYSWLRAAARTGRAAVWLKIGRLG